jgi:pimeloyl-ACP methyl ester carboxylesterase
MWTRTSASKLAEAELNLLQSQRPIIDLRSKPIDIGEGNHINTVEVNGADQAPEKVPIVLCHGYGLALGAWTYNYAHLARGFNRIFAIDWLGCGRSSRPTFVCKGPDETEEWFVESLDR